MIDGYDEVMALFYREQNMVGDSDWSRRSAQRIAGPQTLAGQDTLREALGRLGFPLH